VRLITLRDLAAVAARLADELADAVNAILGGWSTLCASRRVRCTEAAG
jgi:hypothetical protein